MSKGISTSWGGRNGDDDVDASRLLPHEYVSYLLSLFNFILIILLLLHLGPTYFVYSCFMRTVAPVAILGGTVAVYSSAMRLSNHDADFTPMSVVYLMLLALNYAVMPRLTKRFVHPLTTGRSVALAEEVIKMGLAAVGWVVTSKRSASSLLPLPHSKAGVGSVANEGGFPSPETKMTIASVAVLLERIRDWSTASDLFTAGLPSALYAIQGTLTYTAYQNLDAVTFNGLTQLKVLSTALCCYLVLGKQQSATQVASLGMLMISTVVFQGSWRELVAVVVARTRVARGRGVVATSVAMGNGDHRNRRFFRGVLPCLAATFLSGLAGAVSQGSLQMQGGRNMIHRSAYLYTVKISFLSAICLVLSMGMEWLRSRQIVHDAASMRKSALQTADVSESYAANDGDSLPSTASTASVRFFQHWTCATLLPVTTKAIAGLLTALVHLHLGSVIKGFALVIGLIFSALLQFALEGVDLTPEQLVGTALVLLSSWIHFTNPP
jgi:UDP-sugar transporter A1/2/3